MDSDALWSQAGVSGSLRPRCTPQADQNRKGNVHARRPNTPANAARRGDSGEHRSRRIEDGSRRFRTTKALARQALALGVDVYSGYGMSESAPLLCLAQVKSADLAGNLEKEIDIRTKAGMPVPLVDLRLVDTNLNELPRDGKTP